MPDSCYREKQEVVSFFKKSLRLMGEANDFMAAIMPIGGKSEEWQEQPRKPLNWPVDTAPRRMLGTSRTIARAL